jgi:hypothetical protein
METSTSGHARYHCTTAHIKSYNSHAKSSQANCWFFFNYELSVAISLLPCSHASAAVISSSLPWTRNRLTYMAEERTSYHSKRMSRDRYPVLLCDVTARALHSNGPSADTENTSRDIHGTVADVTALAPAERTRGKYSFLYCCVMYRVYWAAYRQRVDQIRYNIDVFQK